MSQLNRRTVIAATTALGVSSILPARVYAQTLPEIQTLRSTSKSWLWAAEDYANSRGFFDKARVKVVSNASNRGTNVAALAGSGVDIVLGDPGEASRARGEKLAIKSFVSTVNKYASNVVLSNAVLKRLGITEQSPVDRKAAALKGLRLGTTGPGAAPDALFRWLAVQAKLDPNTDLRLVPMQGGGPGMLAALQQNVIDGFCLSSPTSDLAVKDRDCGNSRMPPLVLGTSTTHDRFQMVDAAIRRRASQWIGPTEHHDVDEHNLAHQCRAWLRVPRQWCRSGRS
jgi:ABC-type nitrate/sulfonate/bicarbonate transport system substrate-binding protein